MATDPANARLVLRRLIRSLLEKRGEVLEPEALDSFLDSDELADYEQIVEALGLLPPRFARHGREVIDLRMARDPQANDVAASYLFDAPDAHIAGAIVRMLNADPDAWDRALGQAEEPF